MMALNKVYQHIISRMSEQNSKPKSKKMRVYSCCRSLCTIAATVLLLIPIVYLLGSDESFYSQKPLYAAYAQDAYFQSKVAEVQAALNSSLFVNLHPQEADDKKETLSKRWEHLQEFVGYLGYYLNENNQPTVNRLIVPPGIKQQRKGKSQQNVDNQKALEKAYTLGSDGEMNILRNKINKVAAGAINRLKIKAKENKNSCFTDNIKSRLVGEVSGQRIWIITIQPDTWQFHSSEELRKQLTAFSKERGKDKFIVVSLGPADSEWKKLKAMSINLSENIISNMKNAIRDVIKNYFSFKINATKVIETILCQSETSLYQLNNFLHRCNATFNCHNSIRLLRREKVKDEDSKFRLYADELCEQGHINPEDQDFKDILSDLGFYPDDSNEDIQEQLKVYSEIANGKQCKGNKKCSYQWLRDQEEKPKPTKQPTKQPSKEPKRENDREDKTKPKSKVNDKKLIAKSEAKPTKAEKPIKASNTTIDKATKPIGPKVATKDQSKVWLKNQKFSNTVENQSKSENDKNNKEKRAPKNSQKPKNVRKDKTQAKNQVKEPKIGKVPEVNVIVDTEIKEVEAHASTQIQQKEETVTACPSSETSEVSTTPQTKQLQSVEPEVTLEPIESQVQSTQQPGQTVGNSELQTEVLIQAVEELEEVPKEESQQGNEEVIQVEQTQEVLTGASSILEDLQQTQLVELESKEEQVQAEVQRPNEENEIVQEAEVVSLEEQVIEQSAQEAQTQLSLNTPDEIEANDSHSQAAAFSQEVGEFVEEVKDQSNPTPSQTSPAQPAAL